MPDYLPNMYIHERKKDNILFSYNETLLRNENMLPTVIHVSFKTLYWQREDRSTKKLRLFT